MLRIFLSFLLFGLTARAALPPEQRAKIDALTGAAGVYTADEDTHRVAFPRNDLKILIEGRQYAPFMGFSSWAAFRSDASVQGGQGGQVIVMGDIVLLEDEVNPVMSVAIENGLEVTALHNHFFFIEPRVMFMHVGGHGTIERLAPVVRQMIARISDIRAKTPVPANASPGPPIPAENKITGAPIEALLGVKGEANNGMFKVTIGRAAAMHGTPVGKQMGVNTWAAFAGTDDAASVDGDFAVTSAELQPVLKSLRLAGISIVAIHSHMTEEEPRYIFLHYWGKGKVSDLAKALRAALDTQSR